MWQFFWLVVLCQQTQEAATQIEEDEIQDLEETTGSFEYAEDNGQALEQPMLHVPAMDFVSDADGTVQADTEEPYILCGDTMGQMLEDNFQSQPQLIWV